MIKYIVTILFFLRLPLVMQAQTAIDKLPVKIVTGNTDTTLPMLLYISGDGGWNKFSDGLMKTFAQSGYPVVGLNARTYFWQRKTPEQTAADVQALIDHYGKEWNRTKVILIGYSFGADVMPFVYNRLTTATQSNVVHQVLLSPSATTDFEVHVSEMLGYRRNNGKSVLDEINKSIHCNFLFLFGEADDNFPMNKLTIKRYKNLTLPGGHHFDNNIKEVVSTIQNEW